MDSTGNRTLVTAGKGGSLVQLLCPAPSPSNSAAGSQAQHTLGRPSSAADRIFNLASVLSFILPHTSCCAPFTRSRCHPKDTFPEHQAV